MSADGTGTSPHGMAADPALPAPEHHVGHGIRLVFGGHRVTVLSDGGTPLADSEHWIAVYEPGHPVRYYFPAADVREHLLTPTAKTTFCPHKGHAVHYAPAGAGDGKAIAWSYRS